MQNYFNEDSNLERYKFIIEDNSKKYRLSSHRFYSPEKINRDTTLIMAHEENKEGQL